MMRKITFRCENRVEIREKFQSIEMVQLELSPCKISPAKFLVLEGHCHAARRESAGQLNKAGEEHNYEQTKRS